MALQLVKCGCQGEEMFSARVRVVSTFVSGEMNISCCCWKRKKWIIIRLQRVKLNVTKDVFTL